MKFVDTAENHDCPSEGARNPVLAAARKISGLAGEYRSVSLPFVVLPKSLKFSYLPARPMRNCGRTSPSVST
jgi:hypothetical protein